MVQSVMGALARSVWRVTRAHRLWLQALVLTALGALSLAAFARALPGGVEAVTSVEGIAEYRLANGLQVLLVADDSKPTTTVNLTVRVGSRHESYGETGMAHLLEHMLFKGTPTTPNPWAEFMRRGLRANGTTWVDRTNYFASFADNDEHLRWYLAWLADAMVHSTISRRDLDTEMTVVRNEMEMGENSPFRILLQRSLAAAYQWHNYGNATIGARTDVENVDIERLRAFYRQHYRPDNATLIVSGRFDPRATLAWIAERFGPIPRPAEPRWLAPTLDPAQDGERSVTLRRAGGTPALLALYHLPPAAAPDFAAAEVLAIVLGDTPSGRLHKRLVEQRLAASVFGGTLPTEEPGVAYFGAQLEPQQDVDAARTALLDTLEGLEREPVTAEELERARHKWLKAWELRFSDPQQVGVALSEAIAAGDWRLFFLQRDRVRALTLADVQRVARERLIVANRTLGTYLPTPQPVRAPVPQRVDVAEQLKQFRPAPAAAPVPPFDPSPANIEARTQRFTLEHGMQLALLPKPTRGQAVHAVLTLRYGTAQSLAGQAEVEAMLAAMLDKGGGGLTRQQIEDRLDALRTELDIAARGGVLTVSLRTRREHAAGAVALVASLLREPALPADALEEVRRQALAGIASQRDDPQAVADNALARHGNPYPRGDVRHARSFDERAADVRAVTPAQLREFHRRFYGSAHAQFAAVGDFDADALRAAVERAFGGWAAPEPYARVPRPWYAPPPARLQRLTPDKQNAVLAVQQRVALADTDADYAAFTLANFMLGSGGDSRLWRRIREKDGLSYGTWSHVDWSSHEPHSVWGAGAIFAPANRDAVERAVAEEIRRALDEGFSDDEVRAARESLLAFRRLSRAQDERLAGALAANLYLGRTMAVSQQVDEAIAALTPAQVNAALRRHLDPAKFVRALAGDFRQP
jgi:zinc protease